MRKLSTLAVALTLVAAGAAQRSAPTPPRSLLPSRSTAAAATAADAPPPDRPAPSVATVTSEGAPLRGRLSAPAGTLVCLVRPDPAARDLRALADTVVSTAEVGADGSYELVPVGPAPAAGWELLVSAPGYALARAPLGAELSLRPEARVEVQLPAGEELAVALVLDAAGRPLPLPATELVSDASGRLRATRLPAGRCELLIASPDLSRCARLALELAEGETRGVSLTLAPDDQLARRFVAAADAEALEALLSSGEVR
ncbi:MAG: hypothetical protein AB7N76_20275 [Planctomycetota bacterium]